MVKKKSDVSRKGSPPPEGWSETGVGKNKIILTTINSVPIYRKNLIFLPADKSLRSRARALRKMGNLSEIVFWQQVHKGKFYNIDFDRQRVIGNYIVDFYIKSLGLVVEIDGASHNDKIHYDQQRDNYLRDLGLKVWKTTSIEVMMDVERVMERLRVFIVDNYS